MLQTITDLKMIENVQHPATCNMIDRIFNQAYKNNLLKNFTIITLHRELNKRLFYKIIMTMLI